MSNRKSIVILILVFVFALGTLCACHEHEFGEWKTTLEPTCTANGEKQKECACGEKQTETIPATGHEEQILPAIEATCTETGLTEGSQCSNCNKILVGQSQILSIRRKNCCL